MNKRWRAAGLVFTIASIVLITACGNWPIEPRKKTHPIGNSGGEFQQYSGAPYFHTGIDIVDDEPAPNGPYVLTNRAGTVALSLPGAGSLYNGLTVSTGDNVSSQQLYWHLDFNSIVQAVRDADTNGTVLAKRSRVAQLVFWTACDYHHLHYETCDSAGCTEPVLKLWPRNDSNNPVIGHVSLTNNGSTTVYTGGFFYITVNGQVDIVAQAYDRQFVTTTQDHKTGVLKIQYEVRSLANALVKTGPLIDLSTIPPNANHSSILYRTAAPFESNSNYCGSETYYYIVTNADESNPKNFAENFAWDTTVHPNGLYRVRVTVWDPSNNSYSVSKLVRIQN